MIISLLVIVMLSMALCQVSIYRKRAIFLFSIEKVFSQFSFLLFEYLFFRPVGLLYYIPMGVLDFITIVLLSNLKVIPKIVIELQLICFVSLILNLIGMILFECGIKHAEIFNSIYIYMYAMAVCLMIKEDGDKKYKINKWSKKLRFVNYNMRSVI